MVVANRMLLGLGVAGVMFMILGTAAALWGNPFFYRMTPASALEIFLLAFQSVLVGGFVAFKPPTCGSKSVTVGSVIHFLGIACPVCNKVLLYLVGSEVLLLHYEPYRIYVAAGGVVVTASFIIYYARHHIQMANLFSNNRQNRG